MPKSTRQIFRTPAEALAHRTERRGSCLIWTGCRNEKGYGLIKVDGKMRRAHRFAWEQANGPLVPGAEIDHTCHNRDCVNVEHLNPSTRKENNENLAGAQRNSKSRVRGVSPTVSGKWTVTVRHNYKAHYAGRFATLAEAEQAAIELRNRLFTNNLADRIAG